MKQFRAILFSVLLLSSFVTGCAKFSAFLQGTYTGNGIIATDARLPGQFQAVKLEGAYDVILMQGPATEVRLETDTNLFAHIHTTVENGTLEVTSDGSLEPTKGVTVYISSPNYQSIAAEGSSDIRGTTPISSQELSLSLDGSGSYDLGVSVKRLKSQIEGSGTITLTGSAQDHSMKIDGAGNFRTDSLVVNTAKIDISGSGNAAVNVLSRLDASISGSGGVQYRGPVTNVHTSISGSGSVNRSGS